MRNGPTIWPKSPYLKVIYWTCSSELSHEAQVFMRWIVVIQRWPSRSPGCSPGLREHLEPTQWFYYFIIYYSGKKKGFICSTHQIRPQHAWVRMGTGIGGWRRCPSTRSCSLGWMGPRSRPRTVGVETHVNRSRRQDVSHRTTLAARPTARHWRP